MNTFIDIGLILIGAGLTYLFSSHPKLGPIRASSLVTLILIALLKIVGLNWVYTEVLIFGGSFIGMSGVERISKYFIPLSCVIFYFYFYEIAPHVKGFGGALGLGAFLSVTPLAIVNFLLNSLIKKSKAS